MEVWFQERQVDCKIRCIEKPPFTAWMRAAPREYGFYSNVNPQVDHPRWSQAKERRIGEFRKRDTLMFNGYGTQVARLYRGMDLKKFFRWALPCTIPRPGLRCCACCG